MKQVLRSTLIVASCLIGLVSLASKASAAEEVSQHVATITVPSGLSVSDVRDSLYAVLLGRDWMVKEKTDDKVVGYLKHRHNEAQVTFSFDDKKIDMSCWGYKITSSGEREKVELPRGWLKNLRSDLNKRFNKVYSEKQ